MSSMPNTATIPVPKIENDFYDWYVRHESKCAAARAGNHDIVFIGDSITHLFEGHPNWFDRGEAVWRKFYGKRKALNLGFGWDRAQNVLWRLANGEFAGQTPKLVVLLIGTNNLGATPNFVPNSPAQIAEGVKAVCDLISSLSPATHILNLAIFPRDVAASQLRAKVNEINPLLKANAAKSRNVEFLDFGHVFLDSNGEIKKELMPDLVHPVSAGYKLWAEAIEPVVRKRLF